MQKQANNGRSEKAIHRQFLFISIFGIILFSTLAGILGLIPIYKTLKAEVYTEVEHRLTLTQRSYEIYFLQFIETSKQIASRTQIRKDLEKYNQGQITKDTLNQSLSHRLNDAINAAPDLRALYLFDLKAKQILHIGQDYSNHLPKFHHLPTNFEISSPFIENNHLHLILKAPIKTKSQKIVAFHLLIFEAGEIESLAHNLLNYTSQSQLSFRTTKSNNTKPIYYASPQVQKEESYKLRPLLQNPSTRAYYYDGNHNKRIIYERALEHTPWTMTLNLSYKQLFRKTWTSIMHITLMLFGLIISGSIGAYYLLKPLSGKILLRRDELDRRIQETTAELNQELQKRKRSEELVRRKEQQYRNVFENLGDAVSLHNLDSSIVYCSDTFQQIYGYPEDYYHLHGVNELVYSEDRDRVFLEFSKLKTQKKDLLIQYRVIHQTGGILWVEVSGHYIEPSGPEDNAKVICLTRNITKRKNTEEKLIAEQSYIASLLKTAPIGIGVISHHLITRGNQPLLDLLETKEEELINQPFTNLVPGQSTHHLKEIDEKESNKNLEIELITNAGHRKQVLFNSSRIEPENPHSDITFSMVDITARKKNQDRLKTNERQFRKLFEDSISVMLLIDPDTLKIIDANSSACKFYQYTHEEVCSLLISEINTLPKTAIRKAMEEACKQTRSYFSFIHRLKDGTTRFVDVYSNPIQLGGKTILSSVIHDTTQRLKMERDHFVLSTAIEQAAESIIVLNTKGRIIYCNKATSDLNGFSPEELTGRYYRTIVGRETSKRKQRNIATAVQRGKSWKGTISFRRKNKASYLGEGTIAPVCIGKNKTDHYIITHRDISQKQELEKQIRQTQKMKAIGKLAGGIAHDFNNTIQILQGYCDTLTKREIQEKGCPGEYIPIEENLHKLKHLVQQLLVFSQQDLVFYEPIHLHQEVEKVLAVLSEQLDPNIEIQTDLAQKEVYIQADRNQISLILHNLCLNAAESMNYRGKIKITSQIVDTCTFECKKETQRSENYILLEISDTGTGIPPADLPHIFDPYFSTKEFGKGTGLGLATVYASINQLNGSIHVDSLPGKGTSIKICLPVSQKKAERPQDEKYEPSILAQGEKILIAEDEDSIRNFLTTVLKKSGYTVIEAKDGEEAIQLLPEHLDSLDLAILDIVMPKKSGKAVYEEIRKKRINLPILFSTGFSHELLESSKDELTYLIKKPYRLNEFTQKIQSILNQ